MFIHLNVFKFIFILIKKVFYVDKFLKITSELIKKLQQLSLTGQMTSNKGVAELSHKVVTSRLMICRMCPRIVLLTSCLVPLLTYILYCWYDLCDESQKVSVYDQGMP